MNIYKVLLYGGYIGLIEAASQEAADKAARCDQGHANVERVTLATKEYIEWVKAMGGPVPGPKPKLPSEWAREGYFVVKGNHMRVGAEIDYYDRQGIKRQGTVKTYDGKTIDIDGEFTTIITETFKVKHGGG